MLRMPWRWRLQHPILAIHSDALVTVWDAAIELVEEAVVLGVAGCVAALFLPDSIA